MSSAQAWSLSPSRSRWGFNPLVIEACLRPRRAPRGPGTESGGFNPLVIEACLRPRRAPRGPGTESGGFNPLVIEACLRPMDRSWGFSSRSLFQSSRHRGMSSAGMARPLPGQPSGRFQSSRHRGMSSASTRSSPTPRDNWMVSILSSSRHVFGQTMSRNEKTLWDVSILSSSRHVFGRVSMPCVEPMKIGSFNPLVIEACLRPPSTPRCPLRASRGFNPLVIEACLRPIPSRAR